jgi:hypothetical protein
MNSCTIFGKWIAQRANGPGFGVFNAKSRSVRAAEAGSRGA